MAPGELVERQTGESPPSAAGPAARPAPTGAHAAGVLCSAARRTLRSTNVSSSDAREVVCVFEESGEPPASGAEPPALPGALERPASDSGVQTQGHGSFSRTRPASHGLRQT